MGKVDVFGQNGGAKQQQSLKRWHLSHTSTTKEPTGPDD